MLRDGLRVTVEAEGTRLEREHLVFLSGLTEEDYFRLAPENRLAEFADGVVVMHSPVTKRHDEITGFLDFLLRHFCTRSGRASVHRGPYTVRLRPGLDREPDLFCVVKERVAALTAGHLDGAPDFIVEVVSKGTRSLDYEAKRSEYEAAGVGEYWIVDPFARVVVQLARSGEAFSERRHDSGWIESAVLPGFRIQADWLWQDPLPDLIDCLERTRS